MTELTELTDGRRAAIIQREEEATRGPWTADTEQRGDCVVWGPNGKFIANMGAAPHWVPDESGERRHVAFDVDRRDAEFIAHARKDVPLLLAALAASEKIARDNGFALARQAPTVARARAWEQHSITLNAVSWKLATALGEVPPGAERIEGNPEDQCERVIARLASAEALLGWVRDMCTDPWKIGMMDANVMAFADLVIKGLDADSMPTLDTQDDAHVYLGTYCVHGLHDRCKRTCKTCASPCVCPCGHPGAAPTVQAEETWRQYTVERDSSDNGVSVLCRDDDDIEVHPCPTCHPAAPDAVPAAAADRPVA